MNRRSPIAVVGIGCRVAGASSPEALWTVLRNGQCPMGPVPADRFDIHRFHDPDDPRSSAIVTREGGFIEDFDLFDAELFGVSPREARSMDPQHRLLLEVAYRAVEDAGLSRAALVGTGAGVYVGMFTGDFRERVLRRRVQDLDVYVEIGTTRSSAAGRLSHAFDLRGPSAVVDAACASSLLAVHLACQSLWTGESTLAIAGGSNLILEPHSTVAFSRSGMLSSTSRCRFGDASADGFVRSDGVAVVVLKPLDLALADGDRIYALVHGTGSGNDARTGKGLFMTPSAEGQAALMREVWQNGDLPRDRIAFVEAHGTGTRAGDPVECAAITEVFPPDIRAGRPLWVGSVKTNIGHTEGAAGVVGFIKAALSLYHGALPPSLHFDTPNPEIPWESAGLSVPSTLVPLPSDAFAAVSSFGLSGTNAHAALSVPPRSSVTASRAPSGQLLALPLSAHRWDVLRTHAADVAAWLSSDDAPAIDDLAYTAAHRRLEHACRLVAMGRTVEELAASLGNTAPVEPSFGVDDVVFVFSGQGGQWADMGRVLRAGCPAFADALAEVDAAFRTVSPWSPVHALADPMNGWAHDIAQVQPLLVAMEVALARTWMHAGVRPTAVVGHSLGEVAAAWVAGALAPEDAVRVILARSQLLSTIRGQGGMGVVGLDEAATEAWIAPWQGRLSIAVCNAASSTVVAGEPAAIEELFAALSPSGVFCRKVEVDVASHSPQTEPLLPALRATLADIRPRSTDIRVWSTVRAAEVAGTDLDADYWAHNLRGTVRFAATIRSMLAAGFHAYVECGPHPVLVTPILRVAEREGAEVLALPSLRRDAPDSAVLFESAGVFWSHGLRVDWGAWAPPGQRVRMPPLPMRPERYAVDADEPVVAESEERLGPDGRPAHPWLPRRTRAATEPGVVHWEVAVGLRRFPYLSGHKVRGAVVLPGAAYVEMLAAAAAELPDGPHDVLDVRLREMLTLPATGDVTLQVTFRHTGPHSWDAAVASWSADEAEATLHATATVSYGRAGATVNRRNRRRWTEVLAEEVQRCVDVPGRGFGLLRVDSPAAGKSVLASVLAAHLRGGDSVHEVDGAHLVVLPGLSKDEDLATVAARLALFVGPLNGDSVSVIGQVVQAPAAADALAALVQAPGGLPVVPPRPWGGTLPADVAQFYTAMTGRGIEYGPAFRPIVAFGSEGGRAVTMLRVPAELRNDLRTHVLHPAVLDGCFQAGVAPFAGASDGATLLPVGVRRVAIRGRLTRDLRVQSRVSVPRTDAHAPFEVDIAILDSSGALVAEIDGLRVQPVARAAGNVLSEEWLHHWAWTEAAEGEGALGSVALVDDDSGVLARTLEGAGAQVLPTADAVVVWAPRSTVSDPIDALAQTCSAVLRALPGPARGCRTWTVVTQGAWSVLPGETADAVHAAVWGLLRVVSKERPDLRVRAIDLPRVTRAIDLAALARAMSALSAEDELAIRDGKVLAHRLEAGVSANPSPRRTRVRVSDDVPLRLRLTATDTLWSVGERTASKAGTLRVRLEDVRIVPQGGFLGFTGFDARDGHAISGLLPLSAVAHDDAIELHRTSSVPVAFVGPSLPLATIATVVPARIAVLLMGGIRSGDTVVVLGGDTELGFACADVARRAGARVVLTATELAVRAELRESALGRVYATGSLDLPARVREWTGGLAHLVIDARQEEDGDDPLALVRVVGRCLRWPGAPGSGATLVDLGRICVAEPQTLAEAMVGAETGAHSALVAPEDPNGRTVYFASVPTDLVAPVTVDTLFSPSGTYLLTGGTGGLGLFLSRFLVDRGARHLVLVSRSGCTDEATSRVLDALRARGAHIRVETCDVSNVAQVQALVRRAHRPALPLRGVFHLAGVLADLTLANLDADAFVRTAAPKVAGALNLDSVTRHLELDHFVLYSSAAGALGSPGQGNYAAANTALDAIAENRRALGLPAVSIAWGIWGESGLAVQSDNRAQRLEARGLGIMAPDLALAGLERVLVHDADPAVGVFAIDWARWAAAYPDTRQRPSVAHRCTVPTVEAEASLAGLAHAFAAAPSPAEQAAAALQFVRAAVAEVLRVPVARVEPSRGPSALGLDSLMAVELQVRIRDAVGVDVTPGKVLACRDLSEVARLLGTRAPVDERPEIPLLSEDTRGNGVFRKAGRCVLLTGATGFVGAHVLARLLQESGPDVICLVRSADEEGGHARIRASLERWGLPGDCATSPRLSVVVGDLALPGLGLSPEVWTAVSDLVDTILHCGARVNHALPYADLAPTNVVGTAEILRLAASCPDGAAVVHHVSSLGIFPMSDDPPTTAAEAAPLPDRAEPFFGPYATSKWAAEHVVAEARARGLRVHVTRAGALTGSRSFALSPVNDAVWRLASFVLHTGTAPAMRGTLGLTPIDAFVDAFLHLVRHHSDEDSHTWHVSAPVGLSVADLAACVPNGLQLRSIAAWRDSLAAVGRDDAVFPLVPKLQALDLARLDARDPAYECHETIAMLPAALVAALSCDRALLQRYLRVLFAEQREGDAQRTAG